MEQKYTGMNHSGPAVCGHPLVVLGFPSNTLKEAQVLDIQLTVHEDLPCNTNTQTETDFILE